MIDYVGIARKAVECDDMVKLLEGKGEYHCEFFRSGITAIIKMWLNNGCKETPEEICEIIETEYSKRTL